MSTALAFRAASIDITPPWPVAIVSGRGHSKQPCSSVADTLEAGMVVLEQADVRIAIVQVDCLIVGDALRSAVLRTSGLRDEQLFICASHTHFGPGTDASQPLLGPVDARYVDWLAERLSTALRGLLEGPRQLGRLCFGATEVPGVAVNRRLRRLRVTRRPPFVTRAVIAAPDPSGTTDPMLRALRVESEAGDTQAVLWNFACHPVCFPYPDRISAEYPGVVRRALRSAAGREIPVVFFNGFTGDVRPNSTRPPQTAMERVREIVSGPRFQRWTLEEWRAWCTRLATAANDALSAASEISARLEVRRSTVPLAELAADAPYGRTLSVHRISLAEGIAIVGVSAEPMASYSRRVAEALKLTEIVAVGYLDGVFGYLPDEQTLRDGGYEGNGGQGSYVPFGRFRPDVAARAMEIFTKLA